MTAGRAARTSRADMFAAIENCIEEILDVCVNSQGFKLPAFVACVSTDGSVLAVQFNRARQSVETVPLTFHASGSRLEFPINLMVSDSAASSPAQFIIRAVHGKLEWIH